MSLTITTTSANITVAVDKVVKSCNPNRKYLELTTGLSSCYLKFGDPATASDYPLQANIPFRLTPDIIDTREVHIFNNGVTNGTIVINEGV